MAICNRTIVPRTCREIALDAPSAALAGNPKTNTRARIGVR
jgi:hypothetical protein